jgi:hypothetical protein
VTATAAVSANTVITGETTFNQFGNSVALGDVNGDGYADVVSGALGYSTTTGRAYVFHSAGSGGIAITLAASAHTVITGEGTGNSFGFSVALGDVNGDGYADVAAGAFGYNTSTGRVYVFHSAGGAGVTASAAASANTVITGETTTNSFGWSVAAASLPGGGAVVLLAALRPRAGRLRRRRR